MANKTMRLEVHGENDDVNLWSAACDYMFKEATGDMKEWIEKFMVSDGRGREIVCLFVRNPSEFILASRFFSIMSAKGFADHMEMSYDSAWNYGWTDAPVPEYD